jgi:hypothetical protein
VSAESSAGARHPAGQARPAWPYPASWLDRLLSVVGQLPGPLWAYLAGVFLVGYAVTMLLRQTAGAALLSERWWLPPPFLVWDVYLLMMVHYLNRQAGQRLAGFRRVIPGVDDGEYAELAYRLTTLPAGVTLAWSLGWGAIGLVLYLLGGDLWAKTGYPPWEIGLTILSYLVGGAALYHTVHQLREVSRLHGRLRSVDLFQLEPLHLFAGLTVRTALGWAALIYLTALIVPPTIVSSGLGASWALVIALAVAAFIVPLLGMHGRLTAAKQRALWEINDRLRGVVAEMNERIDRRELEGLDSFGKVVSAILTERDLIAKTSTWPWPAGTARGFFTLLLLPIVIRFVQDALGSQMGGLLK